MEALKKIRIASDQTQDLNKGKTTWFNGKLTRINEGPTTTLYLFHESRTELFYPEHDNAEPYEVEVTEAFPVRVSNPVTRSEAINNAEMQYYGLYSAMEVASFNASLARKARKNPNDAEVIEHDHLIESVKEQLTAINVL